MLPESSLVILGEVVLKTGMVRLQGQRPFRGPQGPIEIAAIEVNRPEVAPVPGVSWFGGHRPEEMATGGVKFPGPERGDSGKIVEARDRNHGIDPECLRVVFQSADRFVLDREIAQSAMTPG